MHTPIDRSDYLVVPKPTGLRQLAFGRLLRKRKPKQATAELEEADHKLGESIAALEAGRVVRQLELNASSSAGEDQELDQFVDALLVATVERIEHYRAFSRPAVARLVAAQAAPPAFDFEACRQKAEQAEQIHRRLFGDSRLAFTKFKYIEQAEHMDMLWTIIEQEEYQPALVELCGEDLIGALEASKPLYQAMTEQRELRQEGSKVNLKRLQDELHRRTQNYLIAILAMIDDDDPENVEMIRAALRPVDALRERLEQERSRPATPSTKEHPQKQAELAELLAEEEAVAQEEKTELQQAATPS